MLASCARLNTSGCLRSRVFQVLTPWAWGAAAASYMSVSLSAWTSSDVVELQTAATHVDFVRRASSPPDLRLCVAQLHFSFANDLSPPPAKYRYHRYLSVLQLLRTRNVGASVFLTRPSFSEIHRTTATKFCMVIGSCCSFDSSTSDFSYLSHPYISCF